MAGLKIIESIQDNLVFERAYVGKNGLPVAIVSGVPCNIYTNLPVLRDGMAFCQPLDGRDDWPMGVRVRYQVADDDIEEVRWNHTTDPAVLAAARRFADLEADDRVRPGDL